MSLPSAAAPVPNLLSSMAMPSMSGLIPQLMRNNFLEW